MKKPVFSLILAALLLTNCQTDPNKKYEFRVDGMVVQIDGTRVIRQIDFTGKQQSRGISLSSQMADCEKSGKVHIKQTGGKVVFRQKWISRNTGNACLVTDRFSPGNASIRWETEVTGLGGPWSTPIETLVVYPDSTNARFWTAWGDPRLGEIKSLPPSEQAELGILQSDKTGKWTDPLIPIPFVNDTIWYGAPPYRYENPRLGYCPFQPNLTGIPLLTLSEEKHDLGVSLILSPADTLLDLHLRTRSNGEFIFSRENHRISSANTIRFHQDLIVHESGWRGGLRWMASNYPDYFDPNVPQAHEIAGTGAYSSLETEFDLEKMKKMAFGVNWKASFDFPYMGMFIPPVESDTATWARYGGGTTSIAAMREYSAKMKSQGFHVLSYFNVTEFGANITDPAPPRKALREEDLWKNADDYLWYRLSDAILKVPKSVPVELLSFYPRSRPGGPYFTWGDGIIMDPGEPVYQDFLIEQAEKHIRLIPDAAGICIDRMDWLRMYNEERDDSLSWFGNQPTRSMLLSWRSLMERLAPLMHQSGKVIYVNNHDKRIDLLKYTDGYFDEFTYGCSPLNLTALMGIRRPVMGWTDSEKDLQPDPDLFFQRYLHLGVYPMAPFPGNDHSLLPSEWVDQQYLDYGPLLQLLKGKKWVLEPNCIGVNDSSVKVNLFGCKDDWVIPITFGRDNQDVTIRIQRVKGINTSLRAEVHHPGSEQTEHATLSGEGETVTMVVTLKRGCAVVHLTRK